MATCGNCDGAKEVSVSEYDKKGDYVGSHLETCRTCKGSGRVADKDDDE